MDLTKKNTAALKHAKRTSKLTWIVQDKLWAFEVKKNLTYFDPKSPYITIDKRVFEQIGMVKQDQSTRNTRNLHKYLRFMIGLGSVDDPSTYDVQRGLWFN